MSEGTLQALQDEAAAGAWWRGAVIYQIYPRSFLDTNGDGIGDLPGITSRLDYIAGLGVDAVWISPFYTSPMKDFGYDVADYCDVDPIFGTLADFEALVERAHALGLKVIIDQVYSHTSDAHAWFQESRASRDGEKADWYVWRDPKPDGSPPNNWQSVFGGAAWTWDARRGQYYMHNFLREQPQLNVHNRAVQDALLDVARFWLDRGVDGFRLDAINFAMQDPEFRDNPPWPVEGRVITRPFDLQHHVYNQSHPRIVEFLERLRGVIDQYGARFTVAEIGGPDPLAEMRAFTVGEQRLNSAYSFDFLYADTLTAQRVREAQENWLGAPGEGWPSWAFSNHDAPRCISRWRGEAPRAGYAKLTNALLMCLRGNPILYQGEELGLEQAEVPFERLQDPEAIANWPLSLGRDGARTPMPWCADTDGHGGFSAGEPWLPLDTSHLAHSVQRQQGESGSVLAFTREMVRLRQSSPALRLGDVAFLEAQGDLLAFSRAHAGEQVLCVFNLGAGRLDWTLPEPAQVLLTSGWDGDSSAIPPWSVLIARL